MNMSAFSVRLLHQCVRACVRVPEGELHNAVKLLSGELGVGEPLEVDDENLWQRPEIQLLCGQLVLLTHRTVPEAHTRSRCEYLQ